MSELTDQIKISLLLYSKRCPQAVARFWKEPNASGYQDRSSLFVFVGASKSQSRGTPKKTANARSTSMRMAGPASDSALIRRANARSAVAVRAAVKGSIGFRTVLLIVASSFI